jgi:hypothetical protein
VWNGWRIQRVGFSADKKGTIKICPKESTGDIKGCGSKVVA